MKKIASIILGVFLSTSTWADEGTDTPMGTRKDPILVEKFKKEPPLTAKVSKEVIFFVFVDVQALADKVSEGKIDKELAKALRTVKTIRRSKAVEVVLVWRKSENAMVTDEATLAKALKFLKIEAPSLIVDEKDNLGDTLSFAPSKPVFICDTSAVRVVEGREEMLKWWRDYTLKPLPEKRLRSREESLRKKREKEEQAE